ncbi:MAG: dipeptide/oligopeptide/nickel ABC transporter ATP-binding protein [Ruminococcus sp.]|nr:dipeptide/oligopeptide/nickel ABC transporter ATP-binding protein [Ruminococcus sp.]
MLKGTDLYKTYRGRSRTGEAKAVNGVSLTVADDSITVIVGESGSGKSTLARLLCCIERADSGRILLDDMDLTNYRSSQLRGVRSRVQLVMQDAASSLDAHMSARRILDEPLKLLMKMDKDKRKRRIDELIQMVCFPRELLGHKVSQLSGGQQKRLCIARALAADPQHIIFDESFSGLDMTVKKQILTLLKELQSKLKLSCLIITHDLDTAMFMADTLHVMRCGEIIETVVSPGSFDDFEQGYSKELVKAARYKRDALQ